MRLLYLDIDTLRADHLGCYGYHRATTPNIDALAAEGVRFANVYASDVPCLPSRAALMTGMFGIRNGVVNHGGSGAELRERRCPAGLSEPLRLRVVGRHLLLERLADGIDLELPVPTLCDLVESRIHGGDEPHAWHGGRTCRSGACRWPLDWLERRGRADDWFLHVHLWDPHTPYNVPDDFGNPFASATPVPAWHTEEVRDAQLGVGRTALGPGALGLHA